MIYSFTKLYIDHLTLVLFYQEGESYSTKINHSAGPRVPFDLPIAPHIFGLHHFFIQRDPEIELRHSVNGLYRDMKNLAELKKNTSSDDKMLKLLRDYYLNTN